MRVIVAGSRTINDFKLIEFAINTSPFANQLDTLISGGCKGVDKIAEEWARAKQIEVIRFPAEWNKFKQAAGPIRNAQMAENADALIAIWDGKSSGTKI